MSTKGTPRCDACGRRLRQNQHEVHLSDFLTGQLLGRYHAGIGQGRCMAAAAKYVQPGAVTMATFLHPDRCGDDQENCDAGLLEVA
jgi:hypothetical protein